MWPDVLDMRDFYASSLGHVTEHMLSRKIRAFWPTMKGQNMMALGYTTPYLKDYRNEAKRLVALAPAEQGALSWERKKPNIVVLTEETLLPLGAKSVDCALLIHALEFTSQPRELIREVWRVLVDGGRLLLVVPNRLGFWSRRDKNPFGQGHTYNCLQIENFLNDNMFTPLRTERALYMPPSQSTLLLSMASAWERLGYRWFHTLSGALIIEASKQVYAGHGITEPVWQEQLQFSKKAAVSLKISSRL